MKREELSQLNRKEYERLMDARRRRQKRYRRFQLFCTLLVLTILCATVILVVTVFFKIQTISVTGVTRYTQEEIIAVSNIKLEENTFSMRTKEICQKLRDTYPYVENAKIKRKLPNGVEIQITEAKPAIALENGNSYVYLSEEMRVLETGALEPGDDLLLIRGIELKNVTPGQMVSFDMAHGTLSQNDALKEKLGGMQLEAVKVFMDYVETEGAMNLDLIDVSDVYNIQLICDGRLVVEIGSLSELSYKLKLVDNVVQDELTATDMGHIRMSGDTKVSFIEQNTAEEISRLRAGLPASQKQEFFDSPAAPEGEDEDGQGEDGKPSQDGAEGSQTE